MSNHFGIMIAREFPNPCNEIMKNRNFAFIPLFAGAAIFALASCEVEKTQEGELPEVEVEGETRLPKYDVDAPEVETGTKKVEMEVPTIDIEPADGVPDEEVEPNE